MASLGEVSRGIELYSAASISDRSSFHSINRATGNRVSRQFVDSDSLTPVAREDQVKGYEVASGDFVILFRTRLMQRSLRLTEHFRSRPSSPATMSIRRISTNSIICAPPDPDDAEAFILIREGMKATKTAGTGRGGAVSPGAYDAHPPGRKGMIGSTLNFDYEVRSPEEVFADAPKLTIKGEMLDLARHIIDTNSGRN